MSRYTDMQSSIDPLLLDRIWGEIRNLGIESHIAEMDACGYTIIGPEIACPSGLADRLLEASLQVAERRKGYRPDLTSLKSYAPKESERYVGVFGADDGDSPIGDLMQSMLLEDRIFEEALMNPILLALGTYMCGYSSVLYTMGCFMKGPNKTMLPLHCDAQGPSPLPPFAVDCNMTYALTDFNRDNGSTAFIPGSHKWCRQPQGDECRIEGNPNVVAAECKAGSLVCWHSNTWHGAFNRVSPGLRVSIPIILARSHIRSQENLIDQIPKEILERNPARFAVLTHQGIPYGWANQAQAVTGAERAQKFQAAYYEELGINLAQRSGSMYA